MQTWLGSATRLIPAGSVAVGDDGAADAVEDVAADDDDSRLHATRLDATTKARASLFTLQLYAGDRTGANDVVADEPVTLRGHDW